MDIQKEREAFLNVYVNYKGDSRKIQFNEETEQFMWRKNNVSDTEVEYVHLMNQRWYAWLACAKSKAQAVPEWFDYTKQSPQMDGNYQIFIKGEQITAKWVSRFGFADPIEGDALRQELITHWAMQPQSPKAQDPAND